MYNVCSNTSEMHVLQNVVLQTFIGFELTSAMLNYVLPFKRL